MIAFFNENDFGAQFTELDMYKFTSKNYLSIKILEAFVA